MNIIITFNKKQNNKKKKKKTPGDCLLMWKYAHQFFKLDI